MCVKDKQLPSSVAVKFARQSDKLDEKFEAGGFQLRQGQRFETIDQDIEYLVNRDLMQKANEQTKKSIPIAEIYGFFRHYSGINEHNRIFGIFMQQLGPSLEWFQNSLRAPLCSSRDNTAVRGPEMHYSDVKKIGQDVFHALEWLEGNGIIHSDIKKENICFEPEVAFETGNNPCDKGLRALRFLYENTNKIWVHAIEHAVKSKLNISYKKHLAQESATSYIYNFSVDEVYPCGFPVMKIVTQNDVQQVISSISPDCVWKSELACEKANNANRKCFKPELLQCFKTGRKIDVTTPLRHELDPQRWHKEGILEDSRIADNEHDPNVLVWNGFRGRGSMHPAFGEFSECTLAVLLRADDAYEVWSQTIEGNENIINNASKAQITEFWTELVQRRMTDMSKLGNRGEFVVFFLPISLVQNAYMTEYTRPIKPRIKLIDLGGCVHISAREAKKFGTEVRFDITIWYR